MSSSGHLISGFDTVTAGLALAVFLGGAALAVLAVLMFSLVRRVGLAGMVGVLTGAALVLVSATLGAILFDRQLSRDQAAERRAIEQRSAELVARAIAPGSALACLGVASMVVETACEKALFASPEAVASAVAYVDARLSLLAASAALAERDKSYRPALERLRHSLEEDRFGLVAHVMTARGCRPTGCPELAVLHNADRVVGNMKAQAFEAQVGLHALAWQQGSPAGPTTAATPAQLPSLTAGLSPMPATPTTSGGPSPGKFDFPSSASIPPVSIMNAEPGVPPAAEPKATPAPKRAPARRQTAKPTAPTAPPPAAPHQPAAPPEPPQTSGSR